MEKQPNAKPLPHITVLHLLLHYDEEGGVLLWKPRPRVFFSDDQTWKKWNGRYAWTVFGCNDGQGYTRGTFLGESHAAHRLIWKMVTLEEPEQIDHISGLREQRRNL